MEQTITCISCPVGCRMKVVVEQGEVVSVGGNSCNRGIVYAKQESVAPRRMVTAAVMLQNHAMPLSVKTGAPIPKEKIFECMEEISALRLNAPVKIGQVVIADVCGTGVDVVATKSVG
jgi:CxxC motif-containing protein